MARLDILAHYLSAASLCGTQREMIEYVIIVANMKALQYHWKNRIKCLRLTEILTLIAAVELY
jgi:hypothetical protein